MAVLQVPSANSQFIQLGEFDKVDVGDDLLYLGYPFGYNRLVASKGMVSFTGPINHITHALQIDGIVNHGNSGGPLIALREGQVIGVIASHEGSLSPYLQEIKNLPLSGSAVMVMGIDVKRFAQEVSYAIDRNIQMGIGYATSARYASDLIHK